MHKIKTTLLLSLISFTVFSQVNLNLTNNENFEVVKMLTKKTNQKGLDLSQISGSPYASETFALAKVERTNEKATAELLLRYNGYNDEIEIGKITNQEVSEEALLKDKNLKATFNDKTYQFISFKSKKREATEGYLIVLFEGKKYRLYRQDKKKLSEGRIAKTSLDKDIPPRFRDVETFYVAQGENTPIEVDLKMKSIRKQLLSEDLAKSKEIKKIKSEENLIAFFKGL